MIGARRRAFFGGTQGGFDNIQYTGTGSAQDITNASLNPDMVLVYDRDIDITLTSGQLIHLVFDKKRGVTNAIQTDANSAQSTVSGLTAFLDNGFSLGTATSTNLSGGDYAALCWGRRQGFFDVVTYTGTGSAQNITHYLGAVPGMIWVKNVSTAQSWAIYHTSLGNTKAKFLDTNATAATSTTYWNDTTPTNAVFTVGSSNETNKSGDTYVAYLFGDDGINGDIGSYTGNGSTSGPIVSCGFVPETVFIISAGSGGMNVCRSIAAGSDTYVGLDGDSQREGTGSGDWIDVSGNGFQIVSASAFNTSSQQYLYYAVKQT